MTLKILLSGASGAIGRQILALAEADDGIAVTGRAHRSGFFDADAAGDVLIDFSVPELTARSLEFAVEHSIPMVIGTTGIDVDLDQHITSAAERIPVCRAANFSIGVQVLKTLAAEAARRLGPDFDIEILEAHHRRKLDAPSGTALDLGRHVAAARGLDPVQAACHDRTDRRAPRPPGEIGYQVVRGGDVAGEHTVFFLGDGERLELTHRAGDRSLFARGAVHAARWLIGRPPGLYGMEEVAGSGG